MLRHVATCNLSVHLVVKECQTHLFGWSGNALFSTSCGTGNPPSRASVPPPVLSHDGSAGERKRTRYSGLQKQVLSLYKDYLKLAKQKSQNEEEKGAAIQYIREKFKQKASWPKRDVDTIDAWVRRGKRQLQMLQMSGTVGISFVANASDSAPIQQQSEPNTSQTDSTITQPDPTRGAAAVRKSLGGCSSKDSN